MSTSLLDAYREEIERQAERATRAEEAVHDARVTVHQLRAELAASTCGGTVLCRCPCHAGAPDIRQAEAVQ